MAAARIAVLYLVFATLWIYASDRILAMFVEDMQWLEWLGTVKGVAYVVVTALLLYILLRNWSQKEDVKWSSQAIPGRNWLAVVSFFLIMVVPLLAYSVARVEGPRIRDQAFKNLSSIAQLKVDQIEQWLAERKGDAEVLMVSSGLIDDFDKWLRNHDPLAKDDINRRADALKRAYHYKVELLDPRNTALGIERQAMMSKALATHQVQMDGLHRDAAGQVWLDIMVPLIRQVAGKQEVVGALLLRAPAGNYLFPLVQKWPGPSSSAETLLVRRDGDTVEFLNELRHRHGTALTYRLPLNSPNLPAAEAIRTGKAQTFEGLDYRGVDVLSALRPVTGTDWFLVAKVDHDEIMRPLTTLVAWVSLVSFAAIIAMAIALAMLWRQQQRAHQLLSMTQTSEALKKSQGQLRTFVEQAPISIAMLDRNLNYLATSRRWIAEYGRGHSELIGRNHYEIHADIPDEWKKIHRDALAGAFLKNDDDLWIQADGSRHWLRWAVYPWTNETGETGGIIISAEDITEHKQAEEALRASEQRLSGLVNSAMDAIVAVDAKQKIVLFNPAAELMFGLSSSEVVGQPLDRLLPQSARDAHTEHIHAFGRTGVTSRSMKSLGTLHGLRTNGEAFPIEASISQIDLPSGKLFTVILRDITERIHAEEALRSSEAQFRAVFEASSVGMCQADPFSGRLLRVNRRFCEMTGYSEEELLNRPFSEITHPDDRAKNFEEFTRLVRGNVPEYRDEKRYVCKDGSIIWADITVNLIHDLNLKPLRTLAVIQDITERKQAEDELRASEERYRTLVEQGSDGIFVSDSQGHYIDVNTSGCRMLGYTRDELLGLSIADVIMPEEIPRIEHEVARFADNAVITSEWKFRRKDGSSFPGEVHGRQLPDGRLQAILHDITERKVAEQALLKSESDLNRAQAVGHIGSWRLDVTRNDLTWSAENHRIFGIPEGTPLTYETFLSTVYPDDRAYVDREWRAGLQGKSYDIEHRLLVNGKIKWVREKAELEFDEQGTLLGGFGTTQDVTGRKEAEQKLQLQLRLTKAITDCAADSIFVTDRQGRVTFVNAEVERAFGYTAEELIGKVLHDVIHHHHPDGRPYPFSECPNCQIYTSGDPVKHNEAVFFAKDGTLITVACSNAPLEIGSESIGAVLVAHDISTLKRSEEALLVADQRKNEFLALLAHELRNPMAVTATAAYLLQTKGLTDPEICRWATATITNQTELLKRLVDDLLDVERVGRGRVALLKTHLDLGRLIARVVKEREPLIERRKQHFRYSLPSRPVWVDGDPARLTQVITNLLDNASKFTPANGQIELSLNREESEAVIRVRDNGRGIPPQLLPHIFEIFTQGQVSIARDEGGLGLGLALVKGLVELHGGRATAASEGLNKGAEFTLRLPALANVEPATPDSIAPKELVTHKRRILIGEDNAIAAEGLKHVLQDAGHEVRLALDGAEALAAANEELPEIAIFDIGLPGMDGFKLARILRKLPGANQLLLIALTGYGQEKDRIESKEAGFDYHLTKPADLRQLLEIINNWSPAEHP
jgi:PAS domain S-box-containing protein